MSVWPLDNVLLIVFLNCKSLWLEAYECKCNLSSLSHNLVINCINCISLLSTAQASVTVENYVLELARGGVG